MAFGRNRVTGKGSKDPRKGMSGVPGPIREMLVKAESLFRRNQRTYPQGFGSRRRSLLM